MMNISYFGSIFVFACQFNFNLGMFRKEGSSSKSSAESNAHPQDLTADLKNSQTWATRKPRTPNSYFYNRTEMEKIFIKKQHLWLEYQNFYSEVQNRARKQFCSLFFTLYTELERDDCYGYPVPSYKVNVIFHEISNHDGSADILICSCCNPETNEYEPLTIAKHAENQYFILKSVDNSYEIIDFLDLFPIA